jgi:hypothetical protein
MPKPPPGKLRNAPSSRFKGSGPPHTAITSNSGSPSSSSSVSTPSAGTTRVRSPTTLRSSTSITADGNVQEPWMETATPGKFPNFQKKIFLIVEHLTSKPEYANHAFTKKWTMLKRTPNTPMTADISWWNIKILLGIKDMFQYRDMLVQCPEFTRFMKLQNSKTSRSGFNFGILLDVTTDLAHSLPTLSSPSGADDLSYVFEVAVPPDFDVQTITDTQSIEGKDNATEDKQQVQVTNEITTTAWQTNVSGIRDVAMVEDTDGSIISDGMVDISDPTEDVARVATEV